jgi:hypothetical protein
MKTKPCTHQRLIILGSEESGLKYAKCEKCGVSLRRVQLPGNNFYSWQVVTEE